MRRLGKADRELCPLAAGENDIRICAVVAPEIPCELHLRVRGNGERLREVNSLLCLFLGIHMETAELGTLRNRLHAPGGARIFRLIWNLRREKHPAARPSAVDLRPF